MIHLKEITNDNLGEIMKLAVHDDQKDQVAPNSVSIAQGHYSDIAWFRGIYSDEVPVGFVMLEVDEPKNDHWIWRFMIDKNHQGKGLGKAATDKIIEFFKTETNATKIVLSYVPKDQNDAGGFYKKLGFNETGEIDDGEVVMELIL